MKKNIAVYLSSALLFSTVLVLLDIYFSLAILYLLALILGTQAVPQFFIFRRKDPIQQPIVAGLNLALLISCLVAVKIH